MNIHYLFKRFCLIILTTLAATLFTFILLRLTPGDPAELMLQKVFVGTEEYTGSIEEKNEINARFKLDAPFIVQYGSWLVGICKCDLGTSYTTGQPVGHELALHIWPTFSLAVLALLLSILLTIIVSALYNLCSWPFVRQMLDVIIITSIAVPNFYLGIICILFFSIYLDFLPVSGFGTPAHYILPVITLALTMFGYTATILNDSVTETTRHPFMLTAKAKGLAPASILKRHILRNAAAPVIPYIALQLGYLLGGVVVIETLFSWPGIGKYLVDAIATKDAPVIQACIAAIAFCFSMTNLIADCIICLIDPRVRF